MKKLCQLILWIGGLAIGLAFFGVGASLTSYALTGEPLFSEEAMLRIYATAGAGMLVFLPSLALHTWLTDKATNPTAEPR